MDSKSIKSNIQDIIKNIDTGIASAANMQRVIEDTQRRLTELAFAKSADMVVGGNFADGKQYTSPPGADIPSRKSYPRPGGGRSKYYEGKPTFNSKKVVERTGEYLDAIDSASKGDSSNFEFVTRKSGDRYIGEMRVKGPMAGKIMSLEMKPSPKGRARSTIRKGLNAVWGMYGRMFKATFGNGR